MNKLVRSLLFTLIFIIVKIKSFTLSQTEEKNVPVYQPFPSLIIDTSKLCKDSLSNSLQPFTTLNKNYVAVSLTSCGLYIFDITDLNKPFLVFNHVLNATKGTSTLGLSFRRSNNTEQYLWAGHSSGQFFGIRIDKFPFSLTTNSTSNKYLPVNKIIPWPKNTNVLFLVCYQDLEVGLQYLQGVGVNSINAFQIEFVRQNQYALVTASNTGIQFYTVQEGNDIEKITFTYNCVLKPYFFDVNQFQLIDDNTIAIMMLYKGIYMYSFKQFLDEGAKTCTNTTYQLLSNTPTQGLGGQMFLSKDRKYLFTQFRSVGVRLYDVTQKSFQILQNIRVDSNCKDIKLDDTENLIFYTNSVSLQVFKKTAPNFNRDKPNLLLNSYQQVLYNYFKESSVLGSLDYECLLKEDLGQLYIARANFGAAVFNYTGPGILEDFSYSYRAPSISPTSRIAFLADGVTAYLCRAELGLFIVDYTNPAAPKVIKEGLKLPIPYVNYNYIYFFNNYKYAFICNFVHGFIVSMKDNLNPTFEGGMLDTMKETGGATSLNKFLLTKGEQFAYLGLFTYGILVANITDPKKPYFTSRFFTDGAFDIRYIVVLNQDFIKFDLKFNKQNCQKYKYCKIPI